MIITYFVRKQTIKTGIVYQDSIYLDRGFFINRLLSKLAWLGKTGNFCADLAANFEGISEDMAEKLDAKDAKKGPFFQAKRVSKEV